jgi:hypothetical protein
MAGKEWFYIIARSGINRDGSDRIALLAGPYATKQEAQAMLQPVSHWAAEQSGDPWACFHEYGIITLPRLAPSNLGSITPEALALLFGTPSSSPSADLAASLFGGGAAPEESSAPARQSGTDQKQRRKQAIRSKTQAEQRFDAHERELGGLVPPATGPRPEPAADEQARQRTPPGRENPGRRR